MNIGKVHSITFGEKQNFSSDGFSGREVAQGAVGGGSAALLANGRKLVKVLPENLVKKADTLLDGAEVVLKKSKMTSRFSKNFQVTFKGTIESLGNYKLLKPLAKIAKTRALGRIGAVIGGLAAIGFLAANLATTVNVGAKLFDSQA